MSEKKLADRFREEIEGLDGGPTKVATFQKVARNTVYNWMEKGNIPADKLESLQELGVDAGYVLTGLRTIDFENRLVDLKEVTGRVTQLAEQREPHLDIMKLGPLRDLAYQARLSDEHINKVFDLLEDAQAIYGSIKTAKFDIELLKAGIKLAFKYLEVGHAEDLDADLKVEFIIHILQRLLEEERSPTEEAAQPPEERSADIIQFLDHLKEARAGG